MPRNCPYLNIIVFRGCGAFVPSLESDFKAQDTNLSIKFRFLLKLRRVSQVGWRVPPRRAPAARESREETY